MPKRSLTDLVLDTIDTISGRKNRPNLVRIFRHLNRLYDISLPTCESLLQSLLKEGKVVRVTYKGNISYRNALKWKKYPYYMKKNMGSELPSSLLTNAISELVVQEPDYLSMGVPCEILEEHLLSMHDDNINKEAIHKLLQRELKLESLLQLDNGNYFLGPKPLVHSIFGSSNVDVKLDPIKKVNFPEHCENVIHLREPNCFYRTGDNIIQEDAQKLNLDDSLNKSSQCYISPVNENITLDDSSPDKSVIIDSSSLNETAIVVESSLNKGNNTDDSYIEKALPSSTSEHSFNSFFIESSQSTTKNETNIYGLNNLNGIIEKLACHKLTEQTTPCEIVEQDPLATNIIEESAENSLPFVDINTHVVESGSVTNNKNEEEAHVQESNETDVSITDVQKIIGVESKDQEDTKGTEENINSTNRQQGKVKTLKGSSKPSSPVKSKPSDNEDEEEEKEVKTVSPILERGRRKKKTKYDASDYYFPSLKRKTRDSSDSDRKEEKRKKKKKKKEGTPATNLSGVFAKRVIFPGNTSMCCECSCYVSKVKLDPMIYCTTCSNQGHQSCAYKTMTDKNWYCVDCRQDVETCKICKKMPHEKDRGELYGCNCCGAQYHKGCHSPAIKLPFSTNWHCFSCPPLVHKQDKLDSPEREVSIERDIKSTKVCDLVKSENRLSEVEYFKEEPPDPTNWSSKDVYIYFRKYFDEDVAKNILEQDIDGYTLKHLDRADILKLNFKLGICLKLLLHIRRLQLHSNNLVEIWKN